ncbi:hypothetical protein F511_11572 [Dorcoceras hygrometricum]|uniref:Uncharacterized protein n=1 Tax=Dorcoceras hygrometricum TaxID=472368 RepID=A0A2Z7CWT7_9LAMI|nr:hypothetical protein F511_11572 [Dorcoceras hygrometricum]
MSGRGRGRRSSSIEDDGSGSDARVLDGMAQLLEQFVGQAGHGGGPPASRSKSVHARKCTRGE